MEDNKQKFGLDFLSQQINLSDQPETIEIVDKVADAPDAPELIEIIDEGAPNSIIDNESKDSSIYVPFANLLVEEGVLSSEDIEGYDGSLDGLVQSFSKRIQNEVKEHLNSKPKEVQDFIEMLERGVSLDDAKTIIKNEKDFSYSEKDVESDENIQRNIIEKYLKSIGESDEDISDAIKYYEQTEKLSDKALSYYDKMKGRIEKEKELAIERAEQEKVQHQKNVQKQLEDLKNKVFEIKEIIPGKPLAENIKNSIYQSLTTPVAQDEYGNPLNAVAKKRLENPYDFEIKLHYLNALGVFDGKWDALINVGVTKAAKDFEKQLSSSGNFNSGKPFSIKEEKTQTEGLVSSLHALLKQKGINKP
jgi:hypothetical protein